MAKTFRDKIDDYKDTVFAIIGFANLFRFDDKTKRMDNNVKLAQGRELKTSSLNRISPDKSVTPDLCIQLGDDKGVVAEVKISFPKDQGHWADDFKQLMKYDDDLENWWTTDLKIPNHDIVLLLHQSRTVRVYEYFQEQSKQGQIKFDRPFSIVEFNKMNQSKEYYHFRNYFGEIKASHEVSRKLKYGTSVPTEKLMLNYEKHKLYDSKPPMPYLLHIIWENVIFRAASDNQDLSRIRKNSKIELITSVDKITHELHDNCSFKGFNYAEGEHQPRVPLTAWVRAAVRALVAFKYAEWISQDEGTCKVYFKQLNDVFETFLKLCVEHNIDTEEIESEEYQPGLFNPELSEKPEAP